MADRTHPRDLLDFSGKTVLVTGASRGIGRGIAERFALAGAQVLVNFRADEDRALEVVAGILSRGGQARAIQADVSSREGAEALFTQVRQVGRLDILVNNAGTYPLTDLLEMGDDDWRTVVDINLRSVYLCTQLAGRWMQDKGGGSIINIASIEGHQPAPAHSHYNAAKAAVLMYTRSAALELGRHGIRVNAVSPGLIWYDDLPKLWPDGVARYQARAPLGRTGDRQEVADVCLFLASPGASFVTGAELVVDGGVLAAPAF